MKNSTVKNISEILQNSALNRIISQANELNLLNAKMQQRLPKLYHGFYRIIGISGSQITFEVQSAVIRQGFLMQQAQILSLIQTDFPEVREIKFSVNPNFKPLNR